MIPRRWIRAPRLALMRLALMLLAVPLTALHAQLDIARTVRVTLLDDSTASPVLGFFEAQHTSGSPGEELAWDLKLGAALPLARVSSRSTIALLVFSELTANPYSATGFNPRALLMSPSLMVAHRRGGAEWQLSYFHRCRHDLDNIDPRDTRFGATDGTRYSRVIMLAGVQLAAVTNEMAIGSRVSMRWSSHVERYSRRTEDRWPLEGTPPNWATARGSARIGARGRVAFRSGREVYTRVSGTLVAFGRDGTHGARGYGSGGFEAGVRLVNDARAITGFAGVDRTFDASDALGPRRADIVSVGIRIGSRAFQ